MIAAESRICGQILRREAVWTFTALRGSLS